MVDQLAVNQCVAGSSPAVGAIFNRLGEVPMWLSIYEVFFYDTLLVLYDLKADIV